MRDVSDCPRFVLRPSSFSLLLLCLSLPAFAGFTRVTDGDIVNDGGWSYACGWADCDADGYPDLVVMNNNSNQGKHNFLYLNNGDGTFTTVTDGPVVEDGNSSYGCSWADIDNDGDDDLFVSNYNENNCLYLNEGGGTFTKVTSGRIVTDGGNSTGCGWADYDRDGLLDLFVCNRTNPGLNFLYHNEGGSFTRILAGAIATDQDNSSGCAWGDYDDDGWPDLFVANVQTPNCLYHNDGDGTFTKVTSGAIVGDTSLCNGASWGDYDNDGDLDLVVPTGVIGTPNDLLYRNNGDGTFTKVTDTPITQNPTWSGGSAWGDYDNDGNLDLLIGGYDGPSRLYRGDGAGGFTALDTGVVVAPGVNYIMATTWVDYDRDGQLDLYTVRNNYFGGSSCLYHNEDNPGHWLNVRLVGTTSNRSAIGARVYASATVHSQPVRQMREITTQSGGCNSGQMPLNIAFGLGDAAIVDTLAVWWPSGQTDTLFTVPADQFITITEGQTAVVESPPPPLAPRPLSLDISPNPCRAQAAISLQLTADSPARLEVIDAAGRIVRSWPGVRTSSFVLRTSDLPAGTYFLRVTAGRRSATRTLVVE